MRKSISIIVPLILLFFIGYHIFAQNPEAPTQGTVTSVTDGDTFVLDGHAKIRLLDINAPAM